MLDVQGTTLTDIYFVHDPEYYHVKPGDTTWKHFRTGNPIKFLPKGFAEALQGLYPGRHHHIAVPTQTYYDDVQHTRWLVLLQNTSALNLEQRYLDGLYVKVWIEQLQVPTDDSRKIQYNYWPLVGDAVHTQEVLRRATLPGTLVCSQNGCGSCMAVVQGLHRNPQDAFKCKHVADKARELARCMFCKEVGHAIEVCAKLAERNAALEAKAHPRDLN